MPLEQTGPLAAQESAWQAAREKSYEHGRFPLLAFAQIQPRLSRNYLVKGVLYRGAASLIYGDTHCGKTFLGLDLALHVALGKEWHGRRVRQAGVLYLALEGGPGIENRIAAFKLLHGINGPVPFFVVPCTVDLCNGQADTAEIIDLCGKASQELGRSIELVVVDTVSRALAGGAENSPEGMGAFVANVDRIRAATGAHVMNLHHIAKTTMGGSVGGGPRGHNSLPGAVDTMIHVEVDHATKTRTAKIPKQRDGATGAEFTFMLEVVELGRDEDGDPVTSCVVMPTDEPVTKPKQTPRLPPAQQIALNQLQRAIAAAGELPPAGNHIPPHTRAVNSHLWRSYCYEANVSGGSQDAKKKAFNRAAEALQAKNLVGTWGDWVWPIQAGQTGQNGTCPGRVPVQGDRDKSGHSPLRGMSRVPSCPPGTSESDEALAAEASA